MPQHPQREQAIRRCLDQAEAPAQVAAELGVAASTLRAWLRLARLVGGDACDHHDLCPTMERG